MGERVSINIEGFSHGSLPIPAASRVGPLVMTGGIHGLDPTTGKIPDDITEQVRIMFANLQRIMVAAGGGFRDIVKMTVYVKVPEARAAVNAEWTKAFPDPGSRPARHTLVNDNLAANMLVQCDATAYISV